MPRFPEIERLIRKVETAVASEPDPVAAVALLIKLVIRRTDADPYLLTGAMIEGIATVIAQRIPAAKQGDVSVEAVRMMRDRLHARGNV